MIPLPDHPVLNKPLRSLRGVGPKIEAALAKQGFRRIKDLFHLTPTRYQDLRQVTAIADLTEGQETLVAGEVARLRSGIFPKTRRPFLEIEIEDRTGTLTAVWFHTSPSLKRSLADTERILAFGTVHRYQDRFQMAHPQVRSLAEGETPVPEIRPVYPEIEGVKPGIIRRILEFALKEFTGFPDLFPGPGSKKPDGPILSGPGRSCTNHRRTGPVPCLAPMDPRPGKAWLFSSCSSWKSYSCAPGTGPSAANAGPLPGTASWGGNSWPHCPLI